MIMPKNEMKIKTAADADVIVCGAGPAGVCAALAAARAGAKVCLLENNGCLGGTWTAGLLGWILDGGNKNGLLTEIKSELIRRGASQGTLTGESFPFDIETMKVLLEEMCLKAGIRIRLHTRVCDVVMNPNGRLAAVVTESKSGREIWNGQMFVDATGDGDVAAAAGCRFSLGRPDNGLMQPMSLLALLTGIEFEQVRQYLHGFGGWDEVTSNLRHDLQAGGVNPSYSGASLFLLNDGLYYLMANHQYKRSSLDADDVTAATIAARREVYDQVAALRSLGGRWQNLRLVATAEHIGTREGRRIKGLYEISVDDIIAGRRHPDAICTVTFGVDVHALEPDRHKGIEPVEFKSRPYEIPLRALISADVENLLTAGRCISGDFLPHAGYRVTGNASALGEAAGIAAALAAHAQIMPAAVDCNELLAVRDRNSLAQPQTV